MQTMSIPAEDLLARDTAPVYGIEAQALIRNKVVLVTGAGGSIGSELVRQSTRLGARAVYCLDNDEFALYNLELDLAGKALLTDDHIRLADVRDEALIERIMLEISPDVVFHAAAHKHLPLLERAPEAAVKTNVFGTRSVMRAAVKARVGHVVNISTDKAASPTSVLGWSKRLAEHVTKGYAHTSPYTKLANVRFGNVLGSRGSFFPTLSRLMYEGKSVTITDRDATRYFMTIPEAAGLVIEAACLANGGSTFVLDMGKPVRIEDLVNKYARLAGVPMPEIVYTGLRPGEKVHEVLFDDKETRRPTAHPRIMTVTVDDVSVAQTLDELKSLVDCAASPEEIKRVLAFTNKEGV